MPDNPDSPKSGAGSSAASSATKTKKSAAPEFDAGQQKMTQRILMAIGVIVLIIIFSVFRVNCDWALTKTKPVAYKILKSDNVQSRDPSAKIVILQIPSGSSRAEIKATAKKALTKLQQDNERLEQALFKFFFKNQDPKRHNAAAVLRYNWEGSGQWEYTFSLARANSTGKDIQVKLKKFKRGQFVRFEFILPTSLSSSGAKKEGKDQLRDLVQEWGQKAERLEATMIYEDHLSPFLKCTLKTETRRITCERVTSQ